MHDAIHLVRTRRFLPIFVTQFLGAFNDNLFRTSMVMLVIYGIYRDAEQEATFSAIAGGLFILPFFLLSALAGQLADANDKAVIVRIVKTAEMLIMIVGAAGLLFHNVPLLLAALFAMGVHSTFFGPIKYAILPQHLHKDEVLGGTGLVEAGTYIAILGGTLLGGILVVQRAAFAGTRDPRLPETRHGLAHHPRLDHPGQRDPAREAAVPGDHRYQLLLVDGRGARRPVPAIGQEQPRLRPDGRDPVPCGVFDRGCHRLGRGEPPAQGRGRGEVRTGLGAGDGAVRARPPPPRPRLAGQRRRAPRHVPVPRPSERLDGRRRPARDVDRRRHVRGPALRVPDDHRAQVGNGATDRRQQHRQFRHDGRRDPD